MRRRCRAAFCLVVTAVTLATAPGRASPEPAPKPFASRPLTFAALDGWAEDDHAAALAAFRRTCRAGGRSAELRPACHAGRQRGLHAPSPRRFFESWFEPAEIVPDSGAGFLTGYFEPEWSGSRVATAAHPTPLLTPPPADFPRPLPDRAAIEAGALAGVSRPVVFLDPLDAFVTHVQGSARIRLEDGGTMRVAFAGRNGLPYTSIGRALSEREGIPPAAMGLEGLTAWLRAHPDEAAGIMALNRSFIFFRRADALGPASGPVGAAGVPLTAGRSLAVDRTVWAYGLPVWLEAELPGPDGSRARLRRLVVAQDTGAAIVGAARGDLFVGSGPEAGRVAGPMRERARFVVLRPRPAPYRAPEIRLP